MNFKLNVFVSIISYFKCYICTKLQQIVCLTNVNIFVCHHDRLISIYRTPFWFLCSSVNIHIFFNKLSSSSLNKLCDMPNMTACYERLFDWIVFFGNFYILLHVWNVITPSNFHKSQMCRDEKQIFVIIYGYVSLVLFSCL